MLIKLFCFIFSLMLGSGAGRISHSAGAIDSKAIVLADPILAGKNTNDLVNIELSVDAERTKPVSITGFRIRFSGTSNPNYLSSIEVYSTDPEAENGRRDLFGKTALPDHDNQIRGAKALTVGKNRFTFSFAAGDRIEYTGKVLLTGIEVSFSDNSVKKIVLPSDIAPWRFGTVLREGGQDNCDTYRIPGLVTTNTGTLIAVYDVRYLENVDLQGDIDVGMSRSTDGGQTWEPMKIVMDMKTWGGKPESENGVGDPTVLVDKSNNHIWVVGLWTHGIPGQRAVYVSGPGMKPEETTQLLLVKSEDDGVTWSEPINITPQIKEPEWKLIVQGPGSGITLDDGTLVFSVRIYDSERIDAATLVYSKDHGRTWHIGNRSKPGSNEAQCVQLSDGSIMLNMRDNHNRTAKGATNGRAVAITNDLGATWTMHSTSNFALAEPVCMASLISHEMIVDGQQRKVLFFSNPNDRRSRINMTIKASLDEGMTWPEEYQLRFYETRSFGYSCLTMVDDETIGVLYEGTKDLYFQKMPIREILRGHTVHSKKKY